jgi:hypothetical protein
MGFRLGKANMYSSVRLVIQPNINGWCLKEDDKKFYNLRDKIFILVTKLSIVT